MRVQRGFVFNISWNLKKKTLTKIFVIYSQRIRIENTYAKLQCCIQGLKESEKGNTHKLFVQPYCNKKNVTASSSMP